MPLVFLDFHSTGTNIFYAQPPTALRTNQGFTTRWLAAIRARCPDYRFEQDDSHNTEAATSKAWAVGAFGIPAITAEFGYNTDRDLIRRAAQVAAEEMMHLLLGTAPRSSSTSPLDKRGAQLLMN